MSLNRYLKVQNRSNLEGDLKFEDKKSNMEDNIYV